MQPTVDTQPVRDEMFRRIGRNVVYFQYLEATLRAMIPGIHKKATLKKLQANQHKVSRKRRTWTQSVPPAIAGGCAALKQVGTVNAKCPQR